MASEMYLPQFLLRQSAIRNPSEVQTNCRGSSLSSLHCLQCCTNKELGISPKSCNQDPWPSFLRTWPPNNKRQTPNTSSPLGYIGVPERKGGNSVLCNKIWPSERKVETQGPFCVRFAWGPWFLASVVHPVWETHYGRRSLIMPWSDLNLAI